jgi:hypothetical protein
MEVFNPRLALGLLRIAYCLLCRLPLSRERLDGRRVRSDPRVRDRGLIGDGDLLP